MSRSAAPETVMLSIPVPREALTVVAAPPDLLTQRNVEAATGIPARRFLEMVRAPGFPLAVTREGKLRIVDRQAFVAFVRDKATAPPASAPANDAAPDPVAELAAEMGMRPVSPARRRSRV